jgi:hypothetical protein
MRPDQPERRLRQASTRSAPSPRGELLRVLMLPDFERADAIGSYWGNPKTRTFAELLIDLRGGPDAPGGGHRHATGGRPERLARHMAATVEESLPQRSLLLSLKSLVLSAS